MSEYGKRDDTEILKAGYAPPEEWRRLLGVIDQLAAKLEASERAAAAMREALERRKGWLEARTRLSVVAEELFREALSSSAGKDFVRRDYLPMDCPACGR